MAKRFKFRLDPVLSLRKQHEDQQRRVVAEQLRALHEHREALSQLRGGVGEAINRARQDRQQARLDVAAALQEQRWRLYLERRIAKRGEDIDRLESALDTERAELARRSKDRKALQTLRDRRCAEHAEAEARREQLEMDEVASQLYIRLKRELDDEAGYED